MKAFNLPQACRSALSCIRAAEGAPSFVRAFRKNEHSAPASILDSAFRTQYERGRTQGKATLAQERPSVQAACCQPSLTSKTL